MIIFKKYIIHVTCLIFFLPNMNKFYIHHNHQHSPIQSFTSMINIHIIQVGDSPLKDFNATTHEEFLEVLQALELSLG